MTRFAGVLLAACAMLAGAATTHAETTSRPIQPNQHFMGLVNGQRTGAVIYTICPGPAGASGRRLIKVSRCVV